MSNTVICADIWILAMEHTVNVPMHASQDQCLNYTIAVVLHMMNVVHCHERLRWNVRTCNTNFRLCPSMVHALNSVRQIWSESWMVHTRSVWVAKGGRARKNVNLRHWTVYRLFKIIVDALPSLDLWLYRYEAKEDVSRIFLFLYL